MKAKQLAPLAIVLLCSSAGAQQMYKWVAPDGSVSYSDKPPPANAAKVEKKSISGGASSVEDLPFELATAAKGNPVVLYSSANCAPCDLGRKLLNERGIPFSEKTITSNDDINQFSKQFGSTQIPALTVGNNKVTSFNPNQWNAALSAANYPTSNKMPKTFKNPAPEPLVAAAPKADASATQAAPTPTPAPASVPASGSQPGFHF
ncbi:MAG: glutaredoxin family protein [Burkholderiaceae bacterium]|nr:glutaredoxin family protein [Burkholderiaceae bacterium]